jgi:hypothetical protein
VVRGLWAVGSTTKLLQKTVEERRTGVGQCKDCIGGSSGGGGGGGGGSECRKCGEPSWSCSEERCTSPTCDGVSSFVIYADNTMVGWAAGSGEEGSLMQLDFAQRLATDARFRADFSRSLRQASTQAGGNRGRVFWECAAFGAGKAVAAAKR